MSIKITFHPKGKTVAIRKGKSILEAALSNRIAIQNRCGGKGSCTTCKIRLESDNPLVSLPSAQEIRMLGEEKISDGIRLACQARAYGSLTVSIPEEAWKTEIRKQMQQQSEENEGI